MNITSKITGIHYKVFLVDELQKIQISRFNINESPSTSIIADGKNSFSISRWVSPKRTRSYPYERIYNSLNISKKITVIPIVKDEGAKGDRDFLQWDTISLMSLLDVFVVLGYYVTAKRKGEKINEQKFDNRYVLNKIKQIKQYHSSALHWNLNELKTNLHTIIKKAKISYANIEKITGIKLHNLIGLKNFQSKIGKDVSHFMEFSRSKAKQAQAREFVTIQPKERLSTLTKGKITILNYLGGQYYLTVDEIVLRRGTIFLIEGKHSENQLLPSTGDIKDGLLKMILYCNMADVEVDDKKVDCIPVLKLTSKKLKGKISSDSLDRQKDKFFNLNKFTNSQILLVTKVFEEAKYNKFNVIIERAK